eukprot:gnl/Ergobibamus_cyprinoides/5829.p1 GENE.gnl/Ergobibamus_cyprinoides/5829~~gnl/Ergobibamus_cyprinoides/5829.p1  ORF type:complete len:263 (+),score=43.73 gnl/Ergobibamus_cyprinoides/5829:359-1147(+)
MKAARRIFVTRRSKGVSTSDLIRRVLRRVADSAHQGDSPSTDFGWEVVEGDLYAGSDRFTASAGKLAAALSPQQDHCEALATPAHRRHLTAYVPGVWDLLHPGHVAFLEAVGRRFGRIVVGVLSDGAATAATHRRPVQTVNERALTIACCRYVTDVVFDVGSHGLTPDAADEYAISAIVVGSHPLASSAAFRATPATEQPVPVETVDSACDFTVETVLERVAAASDVYLRRNRRKAETERSFVAAQSPAVDSGAGAERVGNE